MTTNDQSGSRLTLKAIEVHDNPHDEPHHECGADQLLHEQEHPGPGGPAGATGHCCRRLEGSAVGAMGPQSEHLANLAREDKFPHGEPAELAHPGEEGGLRVRGVSGQALPDPPDGHSARAPSAPKVPEAQKACFGARFGPGKDSRSLAEGGGQGNGV